MGMMIDTDVFIEMERRGQPLSTLATAVPPGEALGISAATASELLVGVHRAASIERRLRREAYVESILSIMPFFAFDLRVARVHAQVLVQMVSAGQIIGNFDMIIAATALAHGYDVLTQNTRDFSRVPGLVVRQPDW